MSGRTFTRAATTDEQYRWETGNGPSVAGAVETDHGLMIESRRPWRYAANLWGGHSYAWGDEPECFHTLAEIVAEYRWRMSSWAPYYPCWGETDAAYYGEPVTVGFVYRLAADDPLLADPADGPPDYPSAVLLMGPRGGLRMANA